MTSGALPRPGRRASANEFYEEYLPQLWNSLAGSITWPSWTFELTFLLGAQAHTVCFDAGTLTARSGASDRPLLTFEFDAASWELAARDLLPRIIRWANRNIEEIQADLLRFSHTRARDISPDDIMGHPGRLQIHFLDDAGDEGRYECRVGDGNGPRAELQAHEEDLWALLESKGRLATLLKSRAVIEGDLAWLMRLARLAEPSG